MRMLENGRWKWFLLFIHLVELMLNVFNWALWLKLLVWLCVFVCACVYVTFFPCWHLWMNVQNVAISLQIISKQCIFLAKLELQDLKKIRLYMSFYDSSSLFVAGLGQKNKSRTKQPKSKNERMRNIWETIRFRNSRKSCYFLSVISRQSASCTCSAQLWQICILLPLEASHGACRRNIIVHTKCRVLLFPCRLIIEDKRHLNTDLIKLKHVITQIAVNLFPLSNGFFLQFFL